MILWIPPIGNKSHKFEVIRFFGKKNPDLAVRVIVNNL